MERKGIGRSAICNERPFSRPVFLSYLAPIYLMVKSAQVLSIFRVFLKQQSRYLIEEQEPLKRRLLPQTLEKLGLT